MVMGLAVPVYVNFDGFTRLMESVDIPIRPFVIPNYKVNIGVSAGWNEAIRRAQTTDVEALLIANDDIVFQPGALANLLGHFRAVWDKIDLLTMTNVLHGVPDGDGIVSAADFSCFLIDHTSFPDKFGWFDENFSPAYFEDNDMAYRIKILGGRYGQDMSSHMWHAGSVTQNWNGPLVTSEMFEKNRSYYVTKWGGIPGEERFAKPFNGMTGKRANQWTRLDH